MAYDSATSNVVLFGGVGPTNVTNDTWTWDGTTWAHQTPATSPAPRSVAMMAYDGATGNVVLFGGCCNSSDSWFDDTWTWDGTTWTQQTPATSPPARDVAMMAYDGATDTVVLFGGGGCCSSLNDTWTRNGTTWTQQTPATSPLDRYYGAMAYDGLTGNVVLYGGCCGAVENYFGDTWTWNGTTWTQQSPPSPPARYLASMAYDSASGNLVLFGGNDPAGAPYGDTWTYSGTATPTTTDDTSTKVAFDTWAGATSKQASGGRIARAGGRTQRAV
jgi:hypothetical protein